MRKKAGEIFLLAGVVLLVVFFFSLRPPKNYGVFVVLSGSMEPTIKTGSLVVVKKKANYQKGEIITFRDKKDPRRTITHRIVGVENKGFVTKGDANKASDSALVEKEMVLGRVSLIIPFLGYLFAFSKTTPGLVLVVVLATIVVYSEIINIKKEVRNYLKMRKKVK